MTGLAFAGGFAFHTGDCACQACVLALDDRFTLGQVHSGELEARALNTAGNPTSL